jgi:anaerobic magnesium-protoporphyrin IX monomethyl ester cyclase
VGLSILANEYGITGHIGAKAAKKLSSDIITVLGGVYPTTRTNDVLADPLVDYAVLGEGEYVFPQLIDFIEGKGDIPKEGIAYKKQGQSFIFPQTNFIQDLDSLPFPDNDLIDFHRYANESFKHVVDKPRALPFAKINTSRGCPIGCTFCQVEVISGRKTRFQSPTRVVDEIQWLVENYKIQAIDFLDDNFLGDRQRAMAIFREMIKRKVPVVWNAANVSEFFLSDQLLELMKEAGCVYLSIALESGDPRVLKEIIKKPVALDHAQKILEKAKSLEMDTTTLWVIGSPGETWDEIRTTIKVAEEMDADYTKVNVATPYPGTELFDMAVEGGYLSPDFDFDDLSWGKATISTEEFQSEDLTVLRAFEWDRINFTKPHKRAKVAQMMGVSEEKLSEIRRNTLKQALAVLTPNPPELPSGQKDTEYVPPGNVGDIPLVFTQ